MFEVLSFLNGNSNQSGQENKILNVARVPQMLIQVTGKTFFTFMRMCAHFPLCLMKLFSRTWVTYESKYMKYYRILMIKTSFIFCLSRGACQNSINLKLYTAYQIFFTQKLQYLSIYQNSPFYPDCIGLKLSKI